MHNAIGDSMVSKSSAIEGKSNEVPNMGVSQIGKAEIIKKQRARIKVNKLH